jgi:long-chain acyl-CoA synthetase
MVAEHIPFNNFSEAITHWAKITPEKMYINDIIRNKSYTYGEFDKIVNQTIRFMSSRGVKKGDVVSLCLPNSCELIIIFFASLRMGTVINTLPYSLHSKELNQKIQFIEPNIIFLDKTKNENIKKQDLIVVVDTHSDNSFSKAVSTFSDSFVLSTLNNDDVVCMYNSSGTTSDPKQILYSRGNNIKMIQSVCETFNFNSSSVHLGLLSMSHSAITNYSILPTTYSGGTFFFAENFLSIRMNFWDIVEKWEIDYVQVVPTIVNFLINIPFPNYDKNFIKLKYLASGSAPLSSELQKEFLKKFGIPICNLYGLTETGPTHYDYPLWEEENTGSIGVSLPHVNCKVVDNNFKEVEPNKVGEIFISGALPFCGYFKNRDATNKIFDGNFLKTGDLGYKNHKGVYFYVDRKKDLIIKGGQNIYPGEIDEILFKHPSIREVSTIGVFDNIFGENIVSFVVTNGNVKKKELFEFFLNGFEKSKCPKEIIFIESIPKTSSGKPLKRELRNIYYKMNAIK